MAVYTLSPSERRARAQAVKARRENRYSYSNYIEEQKKAATAQADAIRQAQIDEENEKKNQSFIVRGLSTIGDLAANVITGAVKGLEGIYDLGAGIVGGIGGIFDKDFQNSVQEHIAYDWTTETIGNPLQELTKYSYLEDGGIIESVASGVGQMLPAVAVTVVTGGLGAPAAVAQGASLATLGVSAAGNATEQAYNDGAGYWQGLGYGIASGAVEVATEKLGGGLTGNVFGRGLLDGVGKTVADTGFKRIVKGALEEGAEEVISELANPALKSIYKGKSAFEDYKDPEYWKGVGEAGLVGGLTALAYGGTVGRVVNSARGINEDISESIAQVETLEKKRNNLFADDRLTPQTDTKISDGIRANYQNVEAALKKASEKNRTKFIKTYRLSEAFDTDGSMKPEFAARIGITQNSQNAANTGETVQADTDANGAAQTPLASLDTRYYHPSLRGQEQRISEQLARQGTRVYSGELTATEQANYSKFKKAFNALSQKGLVQPDFVIAESSDNFHSYLDGKTVVLGKDALESDVWQQKIIHEVEHFTEGTKEWSDFASFVFNETDTSEAVQSILRKNYGITQADVDSLPTALAEGNLTDNQRLLVSEVVAEQSEVLLGNEQTIQRLATTKRSLARKLYDRIKNFIKVLKAKTPEEKMVIKKLEKAQQLFEKALDKAGAKYIASQVDSESETQYNRKGFVNGTFPTYREGKGTQANELATRWAHRADVLAGDRTAISFNGSWYLIEKFDSSDLGYQIVAKLTQRQYQSYMEERTNGVGKGQSIQKGVSSITSIHRRASSSNGGVVSDNSVSSRNGRGDSEVQRVGQEQSQRGKTASDRNGDSEGGSSSGQRQFSLKPEGYVYHDQAYYETENGKRIALAMDMQTCKQMIERIYRLVNPNQYEEKPIYRSAEQWLEEVGAAEIALYADNEFIIQEKYLNKIPALIEGEITSEDIIEAYQDKALIGGNNKESAVRLDVSENIEGSDSRFYAPQTIREGKRLYEVAKQKVTNANRDEVMSARAKILIFAHNSGAIQELGITQSELNKNLRSWANYSAKAREISQQINRNVAFSNMWTGIENSSYLYSATVSEEDFSSLVGNITGSSSEYERRYIANTMLALDTHIDYTGINFVFGETNFERGSVRGTYSDGDRTVRVRRGVGQNTVAHEIGHAIDHQWKRDVWNWSGRESTGANNGLSEGSVNLELITDKEVVQWIKNFYAFVDNISDSGNISSEYLQSKNETFARFTARFVEWTMELATGRKSLGYADYFGDNFNSKHYVEFVKILQEKAKLDMRFREQYSEAQRADVPQAENENTSSTERSDVQFSKKPNKEVYRFLSKLGKVEAQYIESQDKWHVYCENRNGYLEYDGVLDEEGLESRFGEEFGADIYTKADPYYVFDKSWIDYYADEIKPEERYDDDYLAEAKETYGTTDNPMLAGYINTDGTMLDFSGGYESRFIDHSEIDVVFDEESGADAMYAYMRMGNIRLMPEAPSLEFNSNVEPTSQQYSTIGKAIDALIDKHGKFYIEFSNDEGRSVANRQYGRGVSTSKIVSDIQYFFRNGSLPRQSDLSQFRYSLKDKYFYQLTDGQIKKLLANSTKFKVYSKVEAEQIINNVLGNYMAFGDSYGELSGKSRREVIEMLWRGLNTADPGKQAKVALDVAEYIIQNAALENLYEDADNEAYIDTISVLKPYLHKLDLSGIKGEIKHRYDRDNSPYLLWGKRRGQEGQTPDVVAMELAENGFYIESTNEADIFFEIDSAYRNAIQNLKRKARELLGDSLTKAERAKLKQDIAKEVLRGFDYTGKPSQLAKIVEKYAEQAKVWKQKYLEERSKNRAINRLLDKTQKLKDLKLGTFLNASQFKSDIFKGSIEKLAAIKYRGNLNQSGTRKIVAGLAEWYSKDNPILEGVFDEEVRSMLEAVATGEGNLTVDDVKMLDNIVGYFTHFVETYNKVYRNGKYVDAKPIAEKFIGILHRNKPVKVGVLRNLFEKYTSTFSDPMTVMRYMDRYDDGFYTDVLTRLREGAVNASVMEMEIREPLEEFYKKHKSYIKGLEKRTVQYQGKEIPAMQAMLLYMTLNREQALAGLAYSGFTYENGKETVRVEGFATDEGLSIEELKVLAQEQRDTLSKQFNETDKEYIGIAEKLFNEDCKEAKRKTDMQRKGYTNVLEDYYVPIRRANIAHSVDTSTFFDEMNRVSNASFNKDTVKGAKGELFIEALDSVLDRHIHAVSQYANLSSAIDEYDKLFNLDISDNPNKPTSVKTESADVWKKGDAYFKKLISDIQGIPVVKGEGSRAMAFIRSGYAKFQLGANPKVWVTQLSSFAAAGSILDVSSITKGIGINGNDVDEYCPLAKVRNNDNTVAMAQGVIDSVGKVGDVLMKPIGKVDRFVIKKLFGACQVQVEKNGGAKVGTKENKQAAGELLTKVILETQQNALATERSAAMRSGSEIMKTLTMFSSDAMKVIGRVIDSVGELSVLKHRRKSATDSAEIESLDKKIKAANTKVRKSVTALAVSAAFMALIAQLFRWLYNKDDEEDVGTTIAVDALGNLLGGLPIFKDIYARLVEGYDLDNYAYSTLNNLLDSAQNIFDIASDVATGNTDDIARNVRNVLYAAGQLFGIPVRNIYNVGYGLINRFSPSTAYKIDDMFYNKNYRSDLNKAIETDDDEMIATIVGVMLDENIGEITNSSARKELDKLTKAGYDVIPRAVSETITYDGEEMALTGRQVSQFKEVYSTAHEAVASLVSLSQYHSATEDVQAKAINFIYDVYYNLALEELLGVDLENKNILFAEAIDIEKLALIIATARAMTADTDDSGKAISGTRKAKIQSYINSLRLTAAQKYMIMGYLGYSNTMGETQVKSYINRLPLTSDEKTQLLQYSGYAA